MAIADENVFILLENSGYGFNNRGGLIYWEAVLSVLFPAQRKANFYNNPYFLLVTNILQILMRSYIIQAQENSPPSLVLQLTILTRNGFVTFHFPWHWLVASHQTASAGNWRNAPHLAPPSPAPRTHARCQHIALPSVHSPAGRRHTALLTTGWLDNANCGHLHQAETSAQNLQSAASNSSYPHFCKSPISLTTDHQLWANWGQKQHSHSLPGCWLGFSIQLSPSGFTASHIIRYVRVNFLSIHKCMDGSYHWILNKLWSLIY